MPGSEYPPSNRVPKSIDLQKRTLVNTHHLALVPGFSNKEHIFSKCTTSANMESLFHFSIYSSIGIIGALPTFELYIDVLLTWRARALQLHGTTRAD